jgi:hypothetical protein
MLGVVADVLAGADRREPDDAPAHLQRQVDRGRVEAADRAVERDAAEEPRGAVLHAGLVEREHVHHRRVVVGLHDDRVEAGLAGQPRRLGAVHAPRHGGGSRMHVQVDGALEQGGDSVGAHAATSKAWSP